MLFLASEIARMTGGALVGTDVEVDGASFDSRLLRPRQLFVPVRGGRDGHDFVEAAFSRGAAATFSARGAVDGRPTIVVDDVDRAFARLGAAARDRLPDRVAGVTGSVGKTSTKDLAAAILHRRFVTTANEKSFNNELGVPFTLVNATDDTEVAIIEMGARGGGHIADLCRIARPTVAIVTSIELAHSEHMGGLDDIARAKGELVEGLPHGGAAILNADDPRVAAMAHLTSADVLLFGREFGSVRATDVTNDHDLRVRFTLRSDWGDAPVHLGVRGEHHIGNALAAASLALLWGVPLQDVVDGLGVGALSPWRMELHIAPSGARILNDSYNAGPASMEAALRSLVLLPTARHHAVLGPMAELGADAEAAHTRIARVAAGLGVRIVAVGTDAYGVDPVPDIDAALATLGPLDGDDSVLIKGSRVAALERVAHALLGS